MERKENLDGLGLSRLSPEGFVVIENEDGEVVLAKKNMIVEGGRSYIRSLIEAAMGGAAVTAKISKLKFGVGLTLPQPDNDDLEDALTDEEYELELDTTLVWKKSTDNVSRGTTDPATVVIGDYFYNDADEELKIGTDGDPDTWEIVADSSGTSLPAISGTTEGDVFYNTTTSKLYVSSKALTVTTLPDELGFEFLATVRGKASSTASVTELGLFIDTTPEETLFSRLVFDAVPFTGDTDAYNIKYYVYF
jgi:hypothetical protein